MSAQSGRGRPAMGVAVFDLLPSPLDSILAFIVVLGVLVFIHELGHYLAARMVGVHVDRKSVV